MDNDYNSTLKPQRYQAAQSFEQRNRELLNKLSEQSRQIKLKEQEKLNDPSHVMERNFSLYNSGANASKTVTRSKSNPKNVQRWLSPQAYQGDQPNQVAGSQYADTYDANNYTLEPCAYRQFVGNQAASQSYQVVSDEADEAKADIGTLRLSQSLNYDDLTKSCYQADQSEEVAPISSLFTIDVEGREIPVENALNEGLRGFMPVDSRNPVHSSLPREEEHVCQNYLFACEKRYSDDNLADDPCAATQNTEFGETAPELNASEMYNNYSSYRMVSIDGEHADGLSPAQIPESLLELMVAIDYLPQRFPQQENTQMILTDQQYYQRPSESFYELDESNLRTLARSNEMQAKPAVNYDYAVKYGKNVAEKYQKSSESSLYQRSMQLQESLTMQGMDSRKLALQLQLLSPEERQCLLRQIIEIDEEQQTRRPKIKDINRPPIKGHSEKAKMLTPKQISHPNPRADLQNSQPPYIIKNGQEAMQAVEPAISRSAARYSISTVMVIQLLSYYEVSDAQSTILPQLISNDKSAVFAAISGQNGDSMHIIQLSSQRQIVPALPQADQPILMFCAFFETAKYVLQQDQRKGRMHVALPRHFVAVVYDIEPKTVSELPELFLAYAENRAFPGKSQSRLECDAQLPVTNNQLASNELIFKSIQRRPQTPARLKIPRPTSEYDLVELHLLSSYGAAQIEIDRIYFFDSSGNELQEVILTANNASKDVAGLGAAGHPFLSKYETAVIYAQTRKHEACLLRIWNSADELCACKYYMVKFNLKTVAEAYIMRGSREDVVLTGGDSKYTTGSQAPYPYADSVAALVSPKSAASGVAPGVASPSAASALDVYKSGMGRSRGLQAPCGYRVSSWDDLCIGVLFLAAHGEDATAFELGNVALKTDDGEVLWPKSLCLVGAEFDFDVRGERVAQNVDVPLAEHQDLSYPLITANHWKKIPRTCCCRVQLKFCKPTGPSSHIYYLLLNSYAVCGANQLKQYILTINGVLYHAPPGETLPPSQLSAMQYCCLVPTRSRAVYQDFLQKIEHFAAIPLKQQLAKSAAEFQRAAQQSDDFYAFVQNRAALQPPKAGRNRLQLNILHFKGRESCGNGQNDVTYATLFQPAGWSLKIDILSYYKPSGELGFEFVQLITNSNQTLDYAACGAVFSSSLQNQVIYAGAGSISDSASSAQNLARYMPWIVRFDGLASTYASGYYAERAICSLCVRFYERYEVSALHFVSMNVAEMSISMDGCLLLDCVAGDTPDIYMVYFCKSKMGYQQVFLY